MRNMLLLSVLTVLASGAAQAQEKTKPLQLQLGNYRFEPVVKPTLADQLSELGKEQTFDPLAKKRITLFIGTKWSAGGAEMQFGLTPKIKHDLIHFEVRY